MNPWSYTARVLAPLDPNNTFDWHHAASLVCDNLPVYLEPPALGQPVDLYTDVQRAVAVPRAMPTPLPSWTARPLVALQDALGVNLSEACYALGRALHRASKHVLGVPRLRYEEVPIDYDAQPLLSQAEYASIDEATNLPNGSAEAWLPHMVKTEKPFFFCTTQPLPCPGVAMLLEQYLAPGNFTFSLVTHHDMVNFDRPYSHTLSIITE